MIFSKEYVERGIGYVLNNIEDEEGEIRREKLIKEKKGDPLACMKNSASLYRAKASQSLYFDKDIEQFKKYMYISSKLKIIGEDTRGFLRGSYLDFWYIIMSNNTDLIDFAIRNIDYISYGSQKDEYVKSKLGRYLARTMMLALKGEWEDVIRRSDIYLKNPSKSTYNKYIDLDFEFLKSLAQKDIEKMKEVANMMLDVKVARKQLRDTSTFFDFYLHIILIMHLKIAKYHGIDLGIDCDVAPKELIDMTPAKEYEEPYEYMKKFDLKTITPEEWLNWIYEYHPDPESLDDDIKRGRFI